MGKNSPLATDRFVPVAFRSHPLIFWFLAFLFATVVSVAAGWQLPERRAYWGLTIPHALGLFSVPLVYKYCYLQFTDWSNNASAFILTTPAEMESQGIQLWMERELQFFCGSAPMYWFAIGISVLATSLFCFSENYLVTTPYVPKFFALLVVFASAFPAGLGLYSIFSGLQMLRRLGRFKVRVTNHKFGVLSTGQMLVNILIAVSLAWSGYVSASVFGIADFSKTFIHLKWPVLLLVVPTFCFFIWAFVLSQFPLHRRMVDFKRAELSRVEQALRGFDSVDYDMLTMECREKIEFYERKKMEILNLPEWPFKFSALLGMGTSTLVMLWPALIGPLLPTFAQITASVLQF